MRASSQYLTWTLSSLLVVAGCKKQHGGGQSDARTLDDLVGGGSAAAQPCEASATVRDSADFKAQVEKHLAWLQEGERFPGTDTERKALAETLTLAPENLLVLVKAAGTTIRAVESEPKECGGEESPLAERAALNEYFQRYDAQRPLYSCMHAPKDGAPVLYYWQAAAGQWPTRDAVIRTDTLRLMALVYSRYSRTRAEAWVEKLNNADLKGDEKLEKQAATVREAYTNLLQTRRILSDEFLADLNSQGAEAAGTKRVTALKSTLDKIDSEMFPDIVYAETVDSFYCNDVSRAALQARYKLTSAAFDALLRAELEASATLR